jgi:hypothetical protein
MNNITIELCAEDRARLDRLVAALEANIPTSTTKKTTKKGPAVPVEPDPDQTTIDDVQEQLAATLAKATEAAEAKAPAPAPVPATPAVTEADIRSMARTLIEKGKKPQLKEIVNKYAPSITEIPEDAMPVVYEQLKKLAEV